MALIEDELRRTSYYGADDLFGRGVNCARSISAETLVRVGDNLLDDFLRIYRGHKFIVYE